MDIRQFWQDVLRQDAAAIRLYFSPSAYIHWHCTNERFTVCEFITANCEYPGSWDGEIERIHALDDLIITVVRVYPKDQSQSFHVTSFFTLEDDLIVSLDEYWADDSQPPQWRQEMKIGKSIC